MDDANKKKLIRSMISIALITVIFLCAAYFVIVQDSFGWFENSRGINSEGMPIESDDEYGLNVARIIVYKYMVEENRYTARIDSPDSPRYMVMNEYDTVFTDRQQYTPMIIKVPVERSKNRDSFTVSIDCSGDLFASGTNLAANISNVIFVRCAISQTLDAVNDNDNENDSQAGNLYAEAAAFFKNSGNKSSGDSVTNEKYQELRFVSYTGSGDGTKPVSPKSNKITFKVEDYKDNLITVASGTNDTELNVYFYVDYDRNLLRRYELDSLFDIKKELTPGESNVEPFDTDLGDISFEYEVEREE